MLIQPLMTLTRKPDGLVHVLAGLGGCGKSTVALEVAQRARKAGCNVWWLQSVEASSVTEALLGLAGQLGAAPGEIEWAMAGRINPSDVLWKQLENTRGWVLIFDNADDLAVLAARERAGIEGAGWLRRTSKGLVIVTTRMASERIWGSIAVVHQVGPLSNSVGARILLDLSPGAGDMASASALSGRLGGLPLALYQAGSYLMSPFATTRTFTAYGQALEAHFEELLGTGNDRRDRVVGTWELSLDALAEQGRPEARMLLRIASCFASPVPIPSILLDPRIIDPAIKARYGNTANSVEGLSGLLAVRLIETRDADGAGAGVSVVLHPLVAETIRRQAGGQISDSLNVALDLFTLAANHLNSDDPRKQPEWFALLPHLYALLRIDISLSIRALTKMTECAAMVAQALEKSGAYLAAFEVADAGLKRTADLGEENKSLLTLRLLRASARIELGQGSVAETEIRQVLASRSRVLGSEEPHTLSTQFALGKALSVEGRPTEAERVFRNVLDAQTRVLGPNHRDTLATRHEIARMLRYLGKLAEAEALYRNVLSSELSTLALDDPEVLSTRHNIANVIAARGRLAEAESGFRKVLDAERQALHPDHPLLLSTRSEIARVLAEQGRLTEAETGFREVLAAKLRILGPDHPSTLLTRQLKARVRADRGHLHEAEAELQQVRDAEQQVLGADHPQNLDTRHEIARVLAEQGRLTEAETGFREVLAAKLRILGPDHPSTLLTQGSLRDRGIR